MTDEKRIWHRMRPRRRRLDRVPPGTVPGTITVDPEAAPPVIRVIAYGPDEMAEATLDKPADVENYLGKCPVVWVNIDGLGEAEVIGKLGELFKIHPLSLEDVVNVTQRPKVENYDEYQFIVTRLAWLRKTLETEQVSIFLGKGFVLTFQEHAGDCFDPIREHIRKARGRIRSAGADYLAYALLDAIVDNYFPLLEQYSERFEILEDRILARADVHTVGEIHDVKRQLIRLRRAVWPLREAVSLLTRDSSPLIADETRMYLRDCYDHAVQILEIVESHREIASGLMDLYLSSVSNRMNEVMKVLTVIATIFIPLTFIAGIYGMNFNPEVSRWNMPELNWAYGYASSLGVMALVALAFVVFFRRKGWLGSAGSDRQGVPPERDDLAAGDDR